MKRGMNAAILVVAWLLGAVPLPAEEARIGWHGETMPEGLVRGKETGEYRWTRDDSAMVYVPPGPFTMGNDEGAADERPAHEVWLDGFYIDQYEVTWARYKKSGLPIDLNPASRYPKARAPDWGVQDPHPVVNVTWHDAQDFVAWAGKRLPTEAEWEKAARGTDARTFPWGNEEPTFDRAVWKDHPTALISTSDADCCAAGVSPYGVFNMAGNVYEWVLDTYEARYYRRSPKRNPVHLGDGEHRSLRGGAFLLPIELMRSSYRYRLLPRDRTPYIGFRSALSGTAGGPDLATSASAPPEDTP